MKIAAIPQDSIMSNNQDKNGRESKLSNSRNARRRRKSKENNKKTTVESLVGDVSDSGLRTVDPTPLIATRSKQPIIGPVVGIDSRDELKNLQPKGKRFSMPMITPMKSAFSTLSNVLTSATKSTSSKKPSSIDETTQNTEDNKPLDEDGNPYSPVLPGSPGVSFDHGVDSYQEHALQEQVRKNNLTKFLKYVKQLPPMIKRMGSDNTEPKTVSAVPDLEVRKTPSLDSMITSRNPTELQGIPTVDNVLARSPVDPPCTIDNSPGNGLVTQQSTSDSSFQNGPVNQSTMIDNSAPNGLMEPESQIQNSNQLMLTEVGTFGASDTPTGRGLDNVEVEHPQRSHVENRIERLGSSPSILSIERNGHSSFQDSNPQQDLITFSRSSEEFGSFQDGTPRQQLVAYSESPEEKKSEDSMSPNKRRELNFSSSSSHESHSETLRDELDKSSKIFRLTQGPTEENSETDETQRKVHAMKLRKAVDEMAKNRLPKNLKPHKKRPPTRKPNGLEDSPKVKRATYWLNEGDRKDPSTYKEPSPDEQEQDNTSVGEEPGNTTTPPSPQAKSSGNETHSGTSQPANSDSEAHDVPHQASSGSETQEEYLRESTVPAVETVEDEGLDLGEIQEEVRLAEEDHAKAEEVAKNRHKGLPDANAHTNTSEGKDHVNESTGIFSDLPNNTTIAPPHGESQSILPPSIVTSEDTPFHFDSTVPNVKDKLQPIAEEAGENNDDGAATHGNQASMTSTQTQTQTQTSIDAGSDNGGQGNGGIPDSGGRRLGGENKDKASGGNGDDNGNDDGGGGDGKDPKPSSPKRDGLIPWVIKNAKKIIDKAMPIDDNGHRVKNSDGTYTTFTKEYLEMYSPIAKIFEQTARELHMEGNRTFSLQWSTLNQYQFPQAHEVHKAITAWTNRHLQGMSSQNPEVRLFQRRRVTLIRHCLAWLPAILSSTAALYIENTPKTVSTIPIGQYYDVVRQCLQPSAQEMEERIDEICKALLRAHFNPHECTRLPFLVPRMPKEKYPETDIPIGTPLHFLDKPPPGMTHYSGRWVLTKDEAGAETGFWRNYPKPADTREYYGRIIGLGPDVPMEPDHWLGGYLPDGSIVYSLHYLIGLKQFAYEQLKPADSTGGKDTGVQKPTSKTPAGNTGTQKASTPTKGEETGNGKPSPKNASKNKPNLTVDTSWVNQDFDPSQYYDPKYNQSPTNSASVGPSHSSSPSSSGSTATQSVPQSFSKNSDTPVPDPPSQSGIPRKTLSDINPSLTPRPQSKPGVKIGQSFFNNIYHRSSQKAPLKASKKKKPTKGGGGPSGGGNGGPSGGGNGPDPPMDDPSDDEDGYHGLTRYRATSARLKFELDKFPTLYKIHMFEIWDRRVRSYCAVTDMAETLDSREPNYVRDTLDGYEVYLRKRAILYHALETHLKFPEARSILEVYFDHMDGTAVYLAVAAHCANCPSVVLRRKQVYRDLIGTRIPRNYSGSYEDFITTWLLKVDQYNQTVRNPSEHIVPDTIMQQLEYMVQDVPTLAAVRTREAEHMLLGHAAWDLHQYSTLLKHQAQREDIARGKRVTDTASERRGNNHSLMLPVDTDSADGETNNTLDLDPATILAINQATQRAIREHVLDKDTYLALTRQDRSNWRGVSTDGQKLILGKTSKNTSSRQAQTHSLESDTVPDDGENELEEELAVPTDDTPSIDVNATDQSSSDRDKRVAFNTTKGNQHPGNIKRVLSSKSAGGNHTKSTSGSSSQRTANMAIFTPDTTQLRMAHSIRSGTEAATAPDSDEESLSFGFSDDDTSDASTASAPELLDRTLFDSSDDDSDDDDSVDHVGELFAQYMQVTDRSQSPPPLEIRRQAYGMASSSAAYLTAIETGATDEFDERSTASTDSYPPSLPGLISPDAPLWLHDGEQLSDADVDPHTIRMQPVQFNGEHDEPLTPVDHSDVIDPFDSDDETLQHQVGVMQANQSHQLVDRGATSVVVGANHGGVQEQQWVATTTYYHDDVMWTYNPRDDADDDGESTDNGENEPDFP